VAFNNLFLTLGAIGSRILSAALIVERTATHNRDFMIEAEVAPASADFSDWDALHRLLTGAFAALEGRIDPPSSLARMTADDLREKAGDAHLVLARAGGDIVGCAFGGIEGDALYLSKLAVAPEWQRRGILRRMIGLLEAEAHRRGLRALTLQTRVELAGNHATFRALGFEKSGETAHPGYHRSTSFTFRKAL
jgi:GNAT superfamily N-acetyltransferase